MTAATRDRAPGGGLFPQEHLAALRQAGPLGVAEAFGDLAHLLKELAGVPGTAFELDGTARGDLTTLLGNLRETGTALEALEARAVIALRDGPPTSVRPSPPGAGSTRTPTAPPPRTSP